MAAEERHKVERVYVGEVTYALIAAGLLEQALALDPKYASAHANLAVCRQ